MMLNYKCCKKREVKCCENCIRFENCAMNKPLNLYEEGLENLGIKATLSIVEDYKKYYAKGWKSHANGLENLLKSNVVETLTIGKYNGAFVIEGVKKQCYLKHGSLDELNKIYKAKIKQKIEALEVKKKMTTDKNKKFNIANKITRLKGELNF